jgi:hypothetical protein
MGAEMTMRCCFAQRLPWPWGVALLALTAASCEESTASRILVHQNEEYGIQARFRAKNRVCTALSGDHPVGFYTWLDRPTECESQRPPHTSSLSITANYNALFKRAPEIPFCRDGDVPRGMRIDLGKLSFLHLQSVRCVTRTKEGLIQVYVTAQGGRWNGRDLPSEMKNTPSVTYYVWLQTYPERFEEDFQSLQFVLANTTIHPPNLTGE